MKEIKLTQGYVALVDDEDFEKLNKFRWFANVQKTKVYAIRNSGGGHKRNKMIYMHREITGAAKKEDVDHVDHNGLNNQKTNIRVCAHADNMKNRAKVTNTSSVFKGVSLFKSKRLKNIRWRAQIQCNGAYRHIGLFCTESEAAMAYNKKAEELHGKFARTNII